MQQMVLLALDPWWNDFYAVGGFLVGVVSLVLGIIAFRYTLIQVWQARAAAELSQTAAEAARDAANKTWAESKVGHERFIATLASRLLSELQRAMAEKEWILAKVRCNDLAELLASLSAAHASATELAQELRQYAQRFEQAAGGAQVKFGRRKWDKLIGKLHAVRDKLSAPFREKSDGETEF